jgi:cytoskeletal protein RodZ
MKLVTVIGAAVLSLTLGLAAPAFAQEQHEQEDQKAKPAAQEEKKAQPEKSAKQEEKPSAQAEKNAKPEEKKAQPEKSAKQDEKPSAQQKNTKPEVKKAQPEKSAKQEEKPAAQQKNTKPEEKNAKQTDKNAKPAEKQNAQQHQPAGNGGGGRIPQARFEANFGRQHTFHVSQADYSNHRFQYGGYWFGFADPWPSNWLYTQDVFVVDINGVYYLCNANFPGVNIALSFTL